MYIVSMYEFNESDDLFSNVKDTEIKFECRFEAESAWQYGSALAASGYNACAIYDDSQNVFIEVSYVDNAFIKNLVYR